MTLSASKNSSDENRSPAALPGWLTVTANGLWCEAGFFIDPHHPAERAVITHGHSDHARPGHSAVLATPGTAEIMRARYGAAAGPIESIDYDTPVTINDVSLRLVPAGHILGSAQVVLEKQGTRVVVSGDFKRRGDPTCAPFEVVPGDVFITEATFGLPVFRHPDDRGEIDRLLASLRLFADRCHLVGVYALGKCQRLIRLLREAGYERPLYLHGALTNLCELYRRHGIELGELRPVSSVHRKDLTGEIVLCPPSAIADRWARGFVDPVVAMASGWMGIRQRARQSGVELPLVISDHADWPELIQTIDDVGAPVLLVTHGREEALVHYARRSGYRAMALSLSGYDEEGS